MIFPIANFYFLESRPAPVLENISFDGVMRAHDRPWLALSLVLCAHLALFAALRPQPQSLSIEPIPDPIMVSLLSTPQTTPQKPMPPATPIEKAQKSVNKPASKPVAPLIKETNQPTPSMEQTSTPTTVTSLPAAEPASKPVLSVAEGATDTQTYQSPNFNAAYLNNPAPDYPSISRREGEQGLVLLRVQVTANGAAASVELQTGSGSTRLDQAALEAVKKWRFVPAKRGEQSVSASVVVPVRFSIEG